MRERYIKDDANTIAGQTVSISGKTAHAWVEIYLENIGWVPVEVTGSDQGEEPDDPIEPDIPEDPSKPTVTVYPTNTTLPYNGKEQFCSGAKISGLPSGYKAEVITNLSGMGLTGVGIKEISLQNGSMQIIIRDSQGNDVTDQFNIRSDTGKLEIQPISLTVYPYNATYEYNGKEQFCPNAYIMGLPKGYTARIITNLSGMGRTDVGTSIISFEMGTIQVIIYDENGNNVTQCCQMDCVEATLEITPKTVVVTTASASQAYKGAALSANSCWITQGDVLDGHTLQILETTVLRVPGEAKNEIVKWRVMDESGSEVSPDNYTIVCQAGTLTLY
jgi:hypothetical protein